MLRLDSFLTTALLIAPVLTCAQPPSPQSGDSKLSADQVSFYEVPLTCPAARGLSCGSAAKPALLSLEKRRSIQEAWLDHAGTTLAVVWKKGTKADARSADIESVADDRGLSLHAITGERWDETLKSFLSRTGWYRGADVARLSEEEAGVIGARLVHRAMLKEPTISAKAALLQTALTRVIREQLIGCTSTQCREDCHEKLANIARQHLNDREFQALMEAEKQGYRPVGDEQ